MQAGHRSVCLDDRTDTQIFASAYILQQMWFKHEKKKLHRDSAEFNVCEMRVCLSVSWNKTGSGFYPWMTPTSSKHGSAWMESDETVAVGPVADRCKPRVSGGVRASLSEVLVFKSRLWGTVFCPMFFVVILLSLRKLIQGCETHCGSPVRILRVRPSHLLQLQNVAQLNAKKNIVLLDVFRHGREGSKSLLPLNGKVQQRPVEITVLPSLKLSNTFLFSY